MDQTNPREVAKVDLKTIHQVLQRFGISSGTYIPEFTWGNLRIDALVVSTRKRWVRGFEIKMKRKDFVNDQKWT